MQEFALPNLPRGISINWYDCAAWAIRENESVFAGYAKSAVTKSLLFARLWQHCESLEIAVDFVTRLDGVFYVIEVDETRDENDYKLGFTTNLDRRLGTYKTIAPHAEHIHCWPTRKSWENTAIDCVLTTVPDCYRLGDSEVVRCEDVVALIVKLNQFFTLMGAVDPDTVAAYAAEAIAPI